MTDDLTPLPLRCPVTNEVRAWLCGSPSCRQVWYIELGDDPNNPSETREQHRVRETKASYDHALNCGKCSCGDAPPDHHTHSDPFGWMCTKCETNLKSLVKHNETHKCLTCHGFGDVVCPVCAGHGQLPLLPTTEII